MQTQERLQNVQKTKTHTKKQKQNKTRQSKTNNNNNNNNTPARRAKVPFFILKYATLLRS